VAEQQAEDRDAGLEQPNTIPTRSRAPRSTPATPMPTDAAKLDNPKEAATNNRASMKQRY
jgi:hypothetical protein